ncbi:MAG: 7TM-DISM domain-containing protein, partial [Pseudobdellovibrionaceae bacterium]|nr:7TM-DISM domain-containing protein [Pseudobdellovibrionaceae bacterium]
MESSSAIQLPLRVWNEPNFNHRSAKIENVHMLYFGSILVMAIYNAFIFVSVRKVTYLFYVMFALSFAAFQAGITGMGFRYV